MGRIASLVGRTACGAAALLLLTACPFGSKAKKGGDTGEGAAVTNAGGVVAAVGGGAASGGGGASGGGIARVVPVDVAPPAVTKVETSKDVVLEVAANKVEVKDKGNGETAKDVVVTLAEIATPPAAATAASSASPTAPAPASAPASGPAAAATDQNPCAGDAVDGATVASLPLSPNTAYAVTVCSGTADPQPATVTVQTHADEPSVVGVTQVAADTVAIGIDAKENPASTEVSIVVVLADGSLRYVRPDTGLLVPEAERWSALPTKQTETGFSTVTVRLPDLVLLELGFAVQARNAGAVETALSEEIGLVGSLPSEEPDPPSAPSDPAPPASPQVASSPSTAPSTAPVATPPAVEEARAELKELRARLVTVQNELKVLRAAVKSAEAERRAAVEKDKGGKKDKKSQEVAATTNALGDLRTKIDALKSTRSSLREQLKAKTQELKAARRAARPRQ